MNNIKFSVFISWTIVLVGLLFLSCAKPTDIELTGEINNKGSDVKVSKNIDFEYDLVSSTEPTYISNQTQEEFNIVTQSQTKQESQNDHELLSISSTSSSSTTTIYDKEPVSITTPAAKTIPVTTHNSDSKLNIAHVLGTGASSFNKLDILFVVDVYSSTAATLREQVANGFEDFISSFNKVQSGSPKYDWRITVTDSLATYSNRSCLGNPTDTGSNQSFNETLATITSAQYASDTKNGSDTYECYSEVDKQNVTKKHCATVEKFRTMIMRPNTPTSNNSSPELAYKALQAMNLAANVPCLDSSTQKPWYRSDARQVIFFVTDNCGVISIKGNMIKYANGTSVELPSGAGEVCATLPCKCTSDNNAKVVILNALDGIKEAGKYKLYGLISGGGTSDILGDLVKTTGGIYNATLIDFSKNIFKTLLPQKYSLPGAAKIAGMTVYTVDSKGNESLVNSSVYSIKTGLTKYLLPGFNASNLGYLNNAEKLKIYYDAIYVDTTYSNVYIPDLSIPTSGTTIKLILKTNKNSTASIGKLTVTPDSQAGYYKVVFDNQYVDLRSAYYQNGYTDLTLSFGPNRVYSLPSPPSYTNTSLVSYSQPTIVIQLVPKNTSDPVWQLNSSDFTVSGNTLTINSLVEDDKLKQYSTINVIYKREKTVTQSTIDNQYGLSGNKITQVKSVKLLDSSSNTIATLSTTQYSSTVSSGYVTAITLDPSKIDSSKLASSKSIRVDYTKTVTKTVKVPTRTYDLTQDPSKILGISSEKSGSVAQLRKDTDYSISSSNGKHTVTLLSTLTDNSLIGASIKITYDASYTEDKTVYQTRYKMNLSQQQLKGFESVLKVILSGEEVPTLELDAENYVIEEEGQKYFVILLPFESLTGYSKIKLTAQIKT